MRLAQSTIPTARVRIASVIPAFSICHIPATFPPAAAEDPIFTVVAGVNPANPGSPDFAGTLVRRRCGVVSATVAELAIISELTVAAEVAAADRYDFVHGAKSALNVEMLTETSVAGPVPVAVHG